MKLSPFVAALALAATVPAQAALTYDLADLGAPVETIDFEAFDGLITTGPEAVAPSVTFTGDDGSVLGAFIADLGDNGLWGAGNRFAATGFIGELRFSFNDGLVSSGAGALVNHFALSPLPFSVVISAYGDNNQIIETHSFTVDKTADDYNASQFLGISRSSADIRSIAFKGVGVVADDFSFTTPVPEPGTWALMLAGIVGVGFLRARRQGR